MFSTNGEYGGHAVGSEGIEADGQLDAVGAEFRPVIDAANQPIAGAAIGVAAEAAGTEIIGVAGEMCGREAGQDEAEKHGGSRRSPENQGGGSRHQPAQRGQQKGRGGGAEEISGENAAGKSNEKEYPRIRARHQFPARRLRTNLFLNKVISRVRRAKEKAT